MKYDNELQTNITKCASIRDNPSNKPIAIIQSVRAIYKLLPKNDLKNNIEFDRCINALIRIRDNDLIESTLRIMAMNTINTMLTSSICETSEQPTEEDIMRSIREKLRNK